MIVRICSELEVCKDLSFLDGVCAIHVLALQPKIDTDHHLLIGIQRKELDRGQELSEGEVLHTILHRIGFGPRGVRLKNQAILGDK